MLYLQRLTKKTNKMNEEEFELDGFIPYQLAVAANLVSQEFGKNYQLSHGLNRAEWRIICHLSELDKDEAISVRDLEQRVHLEKSKVSRAVTRLESRGLVKKQQRPSNARLLDISLTEQGQATFRELVPIANRYQALLIERLEPDDKAQLAALLKKVSARL